MGDQKKLDKATIRSRMQQANPGLSADELDERVEMEYNQQNEATPGGRQENS